MKNTGTMTPSSTQAPITPSSTQAPITPSTTESSITPSTTEGSGANMLSGVAVYIILFVLAISAKHFI